MKIKITDQDPARHNHIEYPMEIGGQKFEVVNITEVLCLGDFTWQEVYKDPSSNG